eukprot:8783609-Pyramimonas_sp.AAC.1
MPSSSARRATNARVLFKSRSCSSTSVTRARRVAHSCTREPLSARACSAARGRGGRRHAPVVAARFNCAVARVLSRIAAWF